MKCLIDNVHVDVSENKVRPDLLHFFLPCIFLFSFFLSFFLSVVVVVVATC